MGLPLLGVLTSLITKKVTLCLQQNFIFHFWYRNLRETFTYKVYSRIDMIKCQIYRFEHKNWRRNKARENFSWKLTLEQLFYKYETRVIEKFFVTRNSLWNIQFLLLCFVLHINYNWSHNIWEKLMLIVKRRAMIYRVCDIDMLQRVYKAQTIPELRSLYLIPSTQQKHLVSSKTCTRHWGVARVYINL